MSLNRIGLTLADTGKTFEVRVDAIIGTTILNAGTDPCALGTPQEHEVTEELVRTGVYLSGGQCVVVRDAAKEIWDLIESFEAE